MRAGKNKRTEIVDECGVVMISSLAALVLVFEFHFEIDRTI
jgi:hypothetical protein